jgi:flagellar hook capping protein FlgD
MKKIILILIVIWLSFSLSADLVKQEITARDSVQIEFQFADGTVFSSNDSLFYQVTILASAAEAGTSLGTGIVLINYSPAAFGDYIFNLGNVEVTKMQLLECDGPPLYNLIVQDNTSNRLAITFEYILGPGYGNNLPDTSTPLLQVCFSIQITGIGAGLYFQEDLMQDQQYYDDNASIYSPVLADCIDNTILELTGSDPKVTPVPEYLHITAYPNPANPVAMFQFQNRSEGICYLDVYNLKGQLVRKISKNTNEESLVEIYWDGRDQLNKVVGNGVYYYKISTKSTSGKGKVTILK